MTGRTDTISRFEELDYRENDGLEVSLLWCRIDNGLTVRVVDTKSDERFRLAVRAGDAMDAFRHPFAYAERLDRAAQREGSGFFSTNALNPPASRR
jgi:hypothetical protein